MWDLPWNYVLHVNRFEAVRTESSCSDEELLAAHCKGDSRVFRTLFERYAKRIYSVMVRSGCRRAEAQDLVQQTFLLLHQARHDFKPELTVRPWLWTIAFNVLRSAQRTHSRSEVRAVRAQSEQSVTQSPSLEDRRGVQQAIERLDSAHQEVVILHWYEGLSFGEIARVLSSNESTVKVRAHRAYKKMKAVLEESPLGAPVELKG